MRLYLTPASGLNSNVVTTGPGLICTTLPCTLNSSNLALMRVGDFFELQRIVSGASGDFVQQIRRGQPILRMLGHLRRREASAR